MFDKDLTILYGVQTRVLNHFVKEIFFDRIYKMDRINYELKKHGLEERRSLHARQNMSFGLAEPHKGGRQENSNKIFVLCGWCED